MQSSPQWQKSCPLLSRDNFTRSGPVQSLALWQYGRRELSCFVINNRGSKKRYLLSRNHGCFEAVERKYAERYRSSRKKRCYLILGPGCAEGFQSLVCINPSGCGALSVKHFLSIHISYVTVSRKENAKVQFRWNQHILLGLVLKLWDLDCFRKRSKSITIWRNNTWAIWRYEWLKKLRLH